MSPELNYDIWEGTPAGAGSKVVEDIMLGDIAVAKLSAVHRAASTEVHGLAVGVAVVGRTTSQTLTNKTIDGDDNTFQDIPGTALKDNTNLPPVGIRPNSGKDS